MNKQTIALLASAATLWATAVASATPASQAASATTSYTTVMKQTEPVPSGGAFTGRLHLTVSTSGIVNGWYTPESEGGYVEVTGGREGNNLWFDLGSREPIRINATMQKDGSIVGTATDFSGRRVFGMPPSFSFVATPQAKTY